MKKSIIIALVLLIVILASTRCKKYKDKDLYGKWSGSIHGCPSDTNMFDTVIIEFKENDAAYLNYYNGIKGYQRWITPYKCKWWIKKEKLLPKQKYWVLYILRYDTLSDPCPCLSICIGSYNDVSFPDTTQYIINKLDDNLLELELIRGGFSVGNEDLFFCEPISYWVPCTSTLNRIN